MVDGGGMLGKIYENIPRLQCWQLPSTCTCPPQT